MSECASAQFSVFGDSGARNLWEQGNAQADTAVVESSPTRPSAARVLCLPFRHSVRFGSKEGTRYVRSRFPIQAAAISLAVAFLRVPSCCHLNQRIRISNATLDVPPYLLRSSDTNRCGWTLCIRAASKSKAAGPTKQTRKIQKVVFIRSCLGRTLQFPFSATHPPITALE